MKKEYNFLPTHKEVYLNSDTNENLVLELEVDNKTEIISGIQFSGQLQKRFEELTLQIESALLNVRPYDVLEVLGKLNIHFSLPVILLIKFIEKYLGNNTDQSNKNYVCACFGVSKKDLLDLIAGPDFVSLNELNQKSCAGLGCGKCVESVRLIYINNANQNFKNEVPKTNLKSNGGFITINHQTPAEFLIEMNKLKNELLYNDIVITGMSGHHFNLLNYSELDQDKIIKLQDLILKRTGVLVFFH